MTNYLQDTSALSKQPQIISQQIIQPPFTSDENPNPQPMVQSQLIPQQMMGSQQLLNSNQSTVSIRGHVSDFSVFPFFYVNRLISFILQFS